MSHGAALINALPSCIEGVRLSAKLSATAPTPTLRELDEALSVAWIAASRLAIELSGDLSLDDMDDSALSVRPTSASASPSA
jgi:hypothetical protein